MLLQGDMSHFEEARALSSEDDTPSEHGRQHLLYNNTPERQAYTATPGGVWHEPEHAMTLASRRTARCCLRGVDDDSGGQDWHDAGEWPDQHAEAFDDWYQTPADQTEATEEAGAKG